MSNSALWKESVNKAFYGYLGYTLLSGIVGAIVGMADTASAVASLANGGGGGSSLGLICDILALAALVYYFLGIKGMKESAVGTVLAEGTANLYTGALLGVIGALVGIIPLIGMVGGLVEIVGWVFMFLGFGKIRKTNLSGLAAKGAQQLWLMMLLTLIGAVIGLIPLIGTVIGLILSIVVLVLAFLGWKNFSNSTI